MGGKIVAISYKIRALLGYYGE